MSSLIPHSIHTGGGGHDGYKPIYPTAFNLFLGNKGPAALTHAQHDAFTNIIGVSLCTSEESSSIPNSGGR